MRRRALLISLAAAGATACTAQAARPISGGPTARATLPEALLADPALGVWPAAYRAATEHTREAYRYAIDRPDVLQWMPCFCGCVNDGHESNVDCFVRTRLAEGRVVLDAHGFG
ncbi:MAG TPA: PCYCGC motif-containing (lipo)protein [Candidatus Limnocylindria bacterium]|nr:PCYCGC motif-containing (lipo)protein [Candidatus Limnocylindria bacterium]